MDGFEVKRLSDFPPVGPPDRRGPWVFDPKLLVIRHEETRYEVDLERIPTAREGLDWINHLSEKTWVTDETLGQFARMLLERLPRLIR